MKGNPNRRAGFSLIELLVTVSLFVLMTCAVFGALGTSQKLLQESSTQASLRATARRVTNRFQQDFLAGILTSVAPYYPVNSQTLLAIPATGYAYGSVTQGPTVKYDFLPDPADPANGKDDDKDGYIDEGKVVRTLGTTATTIANNVKDLRFTLVENVITCTITIEKTVQDSHKLTVTDTESVRLRN